jgi:NAD(P)-dependent dehydrogenase (short-subunit alcohol dehydrogenase family)
MRSFENQRVLVTGSGRGIGRAIARRFAQDGAKLLLVVRSQNELDQTRLELLELTPEVRATALDLIQPDSARQIVAEAASASGGLDILVTNAGAAAQGGFLELEDDAWPAGFGLKMFANLRVIKHAWPLLKNSLGHLVMIGGGTARTPDRQLSLVSAINGGIAALSKSISEQGILDGIQVNLVQPGTVKTSRRQELFEKWAKQEGVAMSEYIDGAVRQLRVTRLGDPSDVAEVVAFLCTEQSRWMQGSIVDVDGGQNKGV